MDISSLKEIIFYVLLIYIAVVAVMYLAQRKMIYFPDQTKLNTVQGVEEITVTTADGLTLSGWVRPADVGKPTLVFFHGNAGHYGHRIYDVAGYIEAGFGVILAGYRGYGGNEGKPSEQGFYNDSRAYIKHLIQSGVREEDIILYGQSIGSGVAVQMATEFKNVKALVLEAPYTSLPDVAATRYFFLPVHLLMKDKFDNLSKIKNVAAPVLMIQGLKDRVVSPALGQKLFAAANEPKEMFQLEDYGHNDLPFNGLSSKVIDFVGG